MASWNDRGGTYRTFYNNSREQLNIPFSSDVFYPPKQLTELPKVNARELIRKELPGISEAITDHILEKSGCIPIYLKLAVSTYRKLIKQDRNILDTSFLFEIRKILSISFLAI